MRRVFCLLISCASLLLFSSKIYAENIEYVKIYVEITNQYAGHTWHVSFDKGRPLEVSVQGQKITFSEGISYMGNWEKLPTPLDGNSTINISINNPIMRATVGGLTQEFYDKSITGFMEWIGNTIRTIGKKDEFTGILSAPGMTSLPNTATNYECTYVLSSDPAARYPRTLKGDVEVKRWGKDLIIVFKIGSGTLLNIK